MASLYVELVKVLHPTRHNVGHFGDVFFPANLLDSTEEYRYTQIKLAKIAPVDYELSSSVARL